MSTTQDQIEAIARECAAMTMAQLARNLVTLDYRGKDFKQAALDEYCRRYAALKVQESGAVHALSEASGDYNGPRFTDRRRAGPRMDAALIALRAIIADGTQKNA